MEFVLGINLKLKNHKKYKRQSKMHSAFEKV